MITKISISIKEKYPILKGWLSKDKPVNERVFVRSILSYFILSFFVLALNIIISLPFWSSIFLFISFLMQFPIIWIGLVNRNIKMASVLFIILMYSVAVVIWFANSGIDGPMILFFFDLLIVSFLLFEDHKVKLLLLNSFISGTLYFIGWFYPNIIIPYNDLNDRVIDLYFSYLFAICLAAILIDILYRSYFHEHMTVKATNRELQNMNSLIKEQNEKLRKDKILLEELATTDSLTNLFNRRKIFEILEYEFNRFVRYETPFSIILIDIDHFKKINDTWGHQTGDFVLQKLASNFQLSLREVDSVGRYGGEEFIIILPNTVEKDAIKIAERLRRVTENTGILIEKNVFKITISLGVSTILKGEKLELSLSRADKYLYKAKELGRNMVVSETVTVIN